MGTDFQGTKNRCEIMLGSDHSLAMELGSSNHEPTNQMRAVQQIPKGRGQQHGPGEPQGVQAFVVTQPLINE